MRNKILIIGIFISFSLMSCKTKTDSTSETGSDVQEFTIVASFSEYVSCKLVTKIRKYFGLATGRPHPVKRGHL